MRITISTDLLDQITAQLEEVFDATNPLLNLDLTAKKAISAVINSDEFTAEIKKRLKLNRDNLKLESPVELESKDLIKTLLRDNLGITSELVEVEPPVDDEPRLSPDEMVDITIKFADGVLAEEEEDDEELLLEAIDEVASSFAALISELSVRLIRVFDENTKYSVHEITDFDITDVSQKFDDFIVITLDTEDET